MRFKKYILLSLLSMVQIGLNGALPCTSCAYVPTGSFVSTGTNTLGALSFSSQGCVAGADFTTNVLSLYGVSSCLFNANTSSTVTSAFPFVTAFSPAGNCLAVAVSGAVQIYSVGPNCTLSTDPVSTLSFNASDIAFSSQGCLAIAGPPNTGPIISPPNQVSLFSVDATTCAATFVNTVFLPTDASVSAISVAFSPSGSCLAVGADNNTVYLYSIDTTCAASSMVTDSTTINVSNPVSLAFSSNNCLAVTRSVTSTAPAAVNIYSVSGSCTFNNGGAPLSTLTNGITNPVLVRFSSGSCLAVLNSGATTIPIYLIPADCTVPAGTAPFITLTSDTAVNSLAFSPDGTCLVTSRVGNSILPPRLSLYTLDMRVPNAPTITQLAVQPCVGMVTVAGTGTGGDLITLFANDMPVGTAAVDVTTGEFIVTSSTLASGSYTFVVRAQDPISLCFSAPSNSVSAQIIAPPAPPILSSAIVTPVDCTTDSVTVNGTAASGLDITLFANGNAVGSGNSGTGSFSITTMPLPGGSYTFTAQAIDSNGCISDLSNGLLVTISPLTPVITSAVVDCSTGILTVTGTAVAGITVTILVNGIPVGATVATGGTFVFSESIINPGQGTTITVSAQTPGVTGVCTSAAVIVSTASGPVISFIQPTCAGAIVVGTTPRPNTSVTVLVNGTARATGVSSSAGRFSVFVPLTSGVYCFAVVDNTIGCQSNPVCQAITTPGCNLIAPNFALGVCCNNRQ